MKYAVLALACLALAAAAAVAKGLDGAQISNSGSTNTAAFEIRVWSDGRAKVSAGGTTRDARISNARKFFDDLKAAKRTNGAAVPCMKSASFGSRTIVKYHGWNSPDLSCPATGPLGSVKDDVDSIVAEVKAGGRRIYLPSNEPRRLPPESAAPVATPRPSHN